MALATETRSEAQIQQDVLAELKWDARMSDTGRLEPSAGGACVLTLCLDLARARKLRRDHLARFDELLEGTLARLRPAAQARLRHEAVPVREWLARERPTGNTLVVFSSRARALMAALVLPDRVHDYLALGRVADVRPFATVVARAAGGAAD